MKPFTLCLWLTLAIGLLTVSGFPQGNTFRSDDPLKVDPDQLPIPQPQAVELSQTVDVLANTFSLRPDKDVPIPEAENVNTLGEGVIVKSCVWNHQAATSSSRTPLINFTFSMTSPRRR